MKRKAETGDRKLERKKRAQSRPKIPARDRYLFDDAAAVQRLRTEAASWLGTPFWPKSKAKGPAGGIDCVGLVEEILGAAGVAGDRKFEFPRSTADYQSHRTELRVLKYLRGQIADDPQSTALAAMFEELGLPAGNLCNLPADRFMPGDLIVLRQGGQFHIPIILEGREFIHCARPFGVAIGDIHDPTYSTHLDAHFRARAR